MVIVNDFEVQLVAAEDETPFQEHKKGPDTYVEVEPNAEYYNGIKKVKSSLKKLKLSFTVDGKELGYRTNYNSDLIDATADFKGMVSWENGMKKNRALRFVKAPFEINEANVPSTRGGMGKIEVKVHEGIFDATRPWFLGTNIDRTPSFETTSPTLNTKKNIRSKAGNHCTTEKAKRVRSYGQGPLLYTITLHYCATPGLIFAGVLEKPPLWEYHRMQKPERLKAEDKDLVMARVLSIKRNRKGNEIIELADSDTEMDADSNPLKKLKNEPANE